MALPHHIERDQQAYNEQKDSLMALHRGRIALFHDGRFIATYNSNGEAYQYGCTKFGLGRFSLITVGEESAIDLGILAMHFENFVSEDLEDERTTEANNRFSATGGSGCVPPASRPRW